MFRYFKCRLFVQVKALCNNCLCTFITNLLETRLISLNAIFFWIYHSISTFAASNIPAISWNLVERGAYNRIIIGSANFETVRRQLSLLRPSCPTLRTVIWSRFLLLLTWQIYIFMQPLCIFTYLKGMSKFHNYLLRL